ncbi:heparan-alpha-glucosaminide N-acetyltransferase domain-containing protein [Flavobacterium sp.]|uniref:heparan-alpha-glucosaminide N-acetyltransferase domain-containing protein n=1 Tax=Flavobacterium sp. TaxID=239 RepID=UPI0031E35D34
METVQQKKRVLAIDIARGMSVIFMMMIHTMLIYGTIETQTKTVLGEIILWLGRGTTMFLVSMGISFVLSRRQTFTAVCKRALYILAIGYGMNFLKFLVPEFVFGGLPEAFVSAYDLKSGTLETGIFFLLLGDILQLAGLTLFIMGLINHYSKSKYVPLIVALAIIAVSKELSGFRVGIVGLDYICDLFFSNQFNVYFPVFPWSAFILIGMFLGRWYKELNENQEVFFKKMLLVGLGFMAVGGILNFSNPEYHFGDYYHLGPGGSILLLGVNLVFYWFINLVVNLFKENNKVFKLLIFCSKHVTSLYVIQWVLINWGMYVLGFWQHDQWFVLCLFPVVISLSICVQLVYNVIKVLLKAKWSSRNVMAQTVKN